VLSDNSANIRIKSNNRIEGAIYSAGTLDLANAELTGPIMADYITLDDDLDYITDDRDEYFRWTLGFGDQESIDWPKHIDSWTTTGWQRN